MDLSRDWLRWIRCPRCAGELESEAADLSCANCARRYPLVGAIPCLVPDPAHFRALWLSRLDDYLEVTQARLHFMQGQAKVADLLPKTRARLQQIIVAKTLEKTRVEELFAELGRGAVRLPGSVVPPRPEAAGGRLPILDCYENVFRDWCWGDPEGARVLEMVTRLVSRAIECLVVYGAGAGRLAFDAHRTLLPGRTLAIDINPLPLLIAERLVRKETLDLYEFPVAPTLQENMVVLQHLSSPAVADERFRLAFADALMPPFAPGSVDVVLTPWFVDVVGIDFKATAAAINRVLRPGGRWIHVGPLHFKTTLAQAYLIDEVHEIVQGTGFEIADRMQQRVPYFDSPVSGSRREETVYAFAAEKSAEAAAPSLPTFVASWVTEPTLPIPMTPELFAMGRTSAFTAMVISMIDGTSSIADLAQAVAERLGADEDAMRESLRAFFAKIATNRVDS